jgi:phthiodiolone/phenolphthiodiolone dimycocerosates ketoreductase
LHRFAVIGRTEQETEAMLDSKAIRAFALAAPDELWRKVGREHPLGAGFRGYVDIIPERYDRQTIEAAIAAVPPELVRDGLLLWGTPEQVARKILKFGDAGLRHVVIAPVSGLVSKRAALYSLRALYEIKRLLRRAA